MHFDVYENGRKIKQLSLDNFIDFYYEEFGYDCGSASAIAHSLELNQGTYVGRGYTIFKTKLSTEEAFYTKPTGTYCAHPNKYLNKITNTLQFYVCPDCKKEV